MKDPDLSEPVTVALSRAEALVLFEWLQRNEATDSFGAIEDQAEERALWNLNAKLETLLSEPFDPHYREIIDAARTILRDDS